MKRKSSRLLFFKYFQYNVLSMKTSELRKRKYAIMFLFVLFFLPKTLGKCPLTHQGSSLMPAPVWRPPGPSLTQATGTALHSQHSVPLRKHYDTKSVTGSQVPIVPSPLWAQAESSCCVLRYPQNLAVLAHTRKVDLPWPVHLQVWFGMLFFLLPLICLVLIWCFRTWPMLPAGSHRWLR